MGREGQPLSCVYWVGQGIKVKPPSESDARDLAKVLVACVCVCVCEHRERGSHSPQLLMGKTLAGCAIRDVINLQL